MSKSTNKSLFQKELVTEALKQSFVKLHPKAMVKNPVMFCVEIGTLVMLIVTVSILINKNTSQGSIGYNLFVLILNSIGKLSILCSIV